MLPTIDVPARTLSDDTQLGQLGLVEIHLTPEEERVLARPVSISEVRMKPTGQPYLSHPSYTRWFNEAFGRLGWSIVPVSKPFRTDKGVARDFILFVHGKPAVFATGEQDYHEANREQTYGDALEACVASALRRGAKRMGVGLELWDKEWIDAYVREHCVQVWTKFGRDEPKKRWRRVVDPKLPGEFTPTSPRDAEDEAPAQRRSAAHYDTPAQAARASQPISKPQVARLHTIILNSGRTPDVVRAWIHARFGAATLDEIRQREYDLICRTIEQPGSLPSGKA
jgi:hypothetical protein